MLNEHEQLAVIHGLCRGSRESWAKLYDAYSVDVWRFVARLLGHDAPAVADVVQETFMEAARTATGFDGTRGTLWAWLTGIAHHRVAAYWRQAQRCTNLRKLIESRAAEIGDLFESVNSPDAAWQRQELAELVRSVLAELPAEYAALLTAKYLDEQDLAELSAQWGGSIDAVKSRLARARREFRAKFERLTRESPRCAEPDNPETHPPLPPVHERTG
ncbi:MAG TPA: sigma-70 family RNA polymerase sigma factor [Pirellulales bacterium]|nr:sigma-70 family RNA polymerase sigma factor [Pirellulales bacterium]